MAKSLQCISQVTVGLASLLFFCQEKYFQKISMQDPMFAKNECPTKNISFFNNALKLNMATIRKYDESLPFVNKIHNTASSFSVFLSQTSASVVLITLIVSLTLKIGHQLSNKSSDQIHISKRISLMSLRSKPSSTPRVVDYSECEALHHLGKWKNFIKHGFSRKSRVPPRREVQSIYEPNYPYPSSGNIHFFPLKQNFSGEWVGASGCELKKLARNELEQCFKGTTSVRMFGDSRTVLEIVGICCEYFARKIAEKC